MSQAHDFAGILGEFVQRSGYNVCQLARLTLLRVPDDPFFANDIPRQTIAQNPHLYAGFVAHGGHVAFVEGVGWFGFWAERQAARFLAHYLLADSAIIG